MVGSPSIVVYVIAIAVVAATLYLRHVLARRHSQPLDGAAVARSNALTISYSRKSARSMRPGQVSRGMANEPGCTSNQLDVPARGTAVPAVAGAELSSELQHESTVESAVAGMDDGVPAGNGGSRTAVEAAAGPLASVPYKHSAATRPSAYEQECLASLQAALAKRTDLADDLAMWRSAFGDRDRGLLCYLRAGDVRYDVPLAVERIVATLAFRRHHGVDRLREDLVEEMAADPIRAHWAANFAPNAPDGCVVLYARLGRMEPRVLSSRFSEEQVRHFVTLFLERCLQLQRESTQRRGEVCSGAYDVIDCTRMRMGQFDVPALRSLGRILTIGQAHFPESLYRCYVINAPWFITTCWRVIKLFVNERVQKKVVFSTGVPRELIDVLGGEEALQAMMASVPEPGG